MIQINANHTVSDFWWFLLHPLFVCFVLFCFSLFSSFLTMILASCHLRQLNIGYPKFLCVLK